MKNLTVLLILCIFFFSCGEKADTVEAKDTIKVERIKLTEAQASNLASLPLTCMEQEYPNKLSQTLAGAGDLASPSELHPAFYGCFDWHSAVHGHWMLVKLLKLFPALPEGELIRQKLGKNLSAENILAEVAYFQREQEKSFERTYGWAWLLKLTEELHSWDDPQAREWENNLQPLTDEIVAKYLDFLPKLLYPIRVGEHPNTGFGLAFAWDYANEVGNKALKNLIEQRAKDYFLNDENCPMSWEPGGFDFLSPCLEEADIMRRVLPKEAFKKWFDAFLPELTNAEVQMEIAKVSDRSDGKLVHLDGVNLSRAWCLYGLANTLPEYQHLAKIANQHLEASIPNIVGDDYAGGHWLASFAIYALTAE